MRVKSETKIIKLKCSICDNSYDIKHAVLCHVIIGMIQLKMYILVVLFPMLKDCKYKVVMGCENAILTVASTSRPHFATKKN